MMKRRRCVGRVICAAKQNKTKAAEKFKLKAKNNYVIQEAEKRRTIIINIIMLVILIMY